MFVVLTNYHQQETNFYRRKSFKPRAAWPG